MATIFNARGGVWTAPTTWKGSKVPAATDTVIQNFFDRSQPSETYVVFAEKNQVIHVQDLTILDHNTLSLPDALLEADSIVIGLGGKLFGPQMALDVGLLSNDGTLEFSGSGNFVRPRDGSLNSQLVNSGFLHVSNDGPFPQIFQTQISVSVDNSDTILAQGRNTLVFMLESVRNTGLMRADGEATIQVRAAITNDGGAVEAKAGSFIVVDTILNRSGGGLVADGEDSIIRINHNATGGAGIISGKAAIELMGDGSGDTSTAIDFQGAGTLAFSKKSEDFTGQISGFGVGSKIDLRDVAFDKGNDFYDPGTRQLTIADDTKTVKLGIFGTYSADDFVFQGNGSGGTLVSFVSSTNEAIDTPDEQIHALYVGYFGRAGDPGGVAYWESQLVGQQANPAALADISAAFSQQAEAKAAHSLFANPRQATEAQVAAFVAVTYENLFGRSPDTEGATYWQQKLTAALHDPRALGTFVLDLISGAQGADAATIANRAHGAKLFEDQLSRRDLPFDADASALANVVIDIVTSDAATIDVAEVMALNFVSEELSAQLIGVAATVSSVIA